MKINNKSKFSFLLSAFMLLGVTSCSSPTSTTKGSLSGVVFLDGQTDHSSITIALYDLAELDPDIVYANQTWPHIGVIINQHTEFDHRFQAPIAVTQTEADGSFELTKIPIGKYNIVAIKDGWGFKYLYEVEIEEGENVLAEQGTGYKVQGIRQKAKGKRQPFTLYPIPNTLNPTPPQANSHQYQSIPTNTSHFSTRSSSITLYPEEILSGYFPDQSNYFLTDHHYIIGDDTVLLPNQSLEIQPGAVVRIDPGKNLIIHGTIKAQGEENNMFWVTSNDGFTENLIPNTQNRNEVALYNSMELSDLANVEDDLIERGKWSWGNETIQAQNNENIQLLSHRFKNINYCIAINNSANSIVKKITVSKASAATRAAISITNSDYNNINENMITDSNSAIYINNSSNCLMDNNYIDNCNYGIYNTVYSQDNVSKNNEITCNIKCIINFGTSSLTIYDNEISGYIGIDNSSEYNYITNAIVQVNNNNFSCSNLALRTTSVFPGGSIVLDATGNYWGTAIETEIQELIWDQSDADPSMANYELLGICDYSNYYSTKINNIGIQ